MTTHRLAVALAVVALGPWFGVRAADGPYRQLKEIAIGGEGGWDYLSVDTAARRLYVSHATKVVVVDIDKNTVVGEIAPAPGVHGIAVAPDLGRGFVSNGRESTVSIVDLKTLQIVGTVKTGENPDAILYEPVHKEVYAFNGRGKSATVFDAKTGEVRATIPLPGKPEFAVFDEKAGRIYNNIEDTSQLVAIDPATHAVAATWPIAPGEEASGLALDPATHRLFVGCSNNLMLMVDATTGKVLASVPIGPGVDANAFDPGTGPRLRVEQRRHPDRGPAGGEGQADRRADPGHAEALEDDDARPEDAPAVRRGRGVRAADHGPGRQAAAPAGRRRLVQGRGLRDGGPARPLSAVAGPRIEGAFTRDETAGSRRAGSRWSSPRPPRRGAQEAPLTFQSALDLAIANNLDLAAARRGRAVREAEVKAAGQHPNPDLVFESTKDTPHQMLSLDIPFEPWKRSRRIDLAREELKLADVDDAAAMQALRRERAAGLLRPPRGGRGRDPRAVDGGGGDARARGGAGPVRGGGRPAPRRDGGGPGPGPGEGRPRAGAVGAARRAGRAERAPEPAAHPAPGGRGRPGGGRAPAAGRPGGRARRGRERRAARRRARGRDRGPPAGAAEGRALPDARLLRSARSSTPPASSTSATARA